LSFRIFYIWNALDELPQSQDLNPPAFTDYSVPDPIADFRPLVDGERDQVVAASPLNVEPRGWTTIVAHFALVTASNRSISGNVEFHSGLQLIFPRPIEIKRWTLKLPGFRG
jgi:hypothetical protein